MTARFTPECRRCARLAGHLAAVRRAHPRYYARPVPSFGDRRARLLVVGLAPGLHGANASGRPFTGDHAGILLYRTLHRHGFASAADSRGSGDGLTLADCRITNAVRCLPPANKPLPAEIANCAPYLAAELAALPAAGVVIALGRVAHTAVLRALGLTAAHYAFAHGAEHALGVRALLLIDSYHCSRYNTQTGRLTAAMFERVFAAAATRLAATST